MHNLNDILNNAVEWARECGDIQLSYFRTDKLHSHAKFNESDIVTEADGRCEELILRHIAEEFPGHSVLGEESGEHAGNGEWRWVIDPLDGTTNFNAGLPAFCVSIALEHRGETVVAVVYAPYLRELFTAVKGQGAWLNGKPLHCAATADMARAVISTGFPVDKDTNPDNNLDNFARVMPRVRGMRRLGSAALDMSYVGAGFLDAYWELHLHLWDIAAASLIARESGACVTELRRTSEMDISVYASTPALAPILGELLK